ncbi:YbhB/YbcL family Raf kinase inhibitor-like protein [Microbulbifer sp. 2205BS26-8]|uniref:YbhB/YbcL family Raf kinase inhibitor-like protein n=1 Tax=Microbulbifer sp. 2205BS26-8 TaxID=3064386 RepID=UPI00273D6B15|nr:YbhB/YbcL family Raf kinase inhibitor-like protein [Microbulbifer sp. 2205BS26-8]MDP5210384.1 YbhB/YbcL family Raf kinase inhibitor-like protein [Microbulbifer sp. 2205BS26-8]
MGVLAMHFGFCRLHCRNLAKGLVASALLLMAMISHAGQLALSSSSLSPRQKMPLAHVYGGCGGENLSPQLSWKGAPEGTKSYAVMVYDPDAPTGSGWWHWVVFNIPADTTSLPEGAGDLKNGLIPEAIQVSNDYGNLGYGGACPPKGHGDHRYRFQVFALKVESLPLDENASPAKVGFHVNANKLAEAELEVLWGR